MTVKTPTFSLKYKIFVLANQDVVDYQSLFVHILCMRITTKKVERWTSTVHDMEFGWL